ncbi:hypothetical protein GIB67_004535 [Kingdonia uniflora]|uniref:Uncharacterized protein n=1 Tax=Kingdonia uniflora TaxID=39325 RepID=A0A7J7MKY1_9MAGN|nr:hypothetical protein GIB67_004535 [Kingdonia uniflora]
MATLQFKDDCDSMKVGLREFDSSWTWQANELRAIGWSRDVEMEKRFSSPSVICHSFVLDADVELIECGKSCIVRLGSERTFGRDWRYPRRAVRRRRPWFVEKSDIPQCQGRRRFAAGMQRISEGAMLECTAHTFFRRFETKRQYPEEKADSSRMKVRSLRTSVGMGEVKMQKIESLQSRVGDGPRRGRRDYFKCGRQKARVNWLQSGDRNSAFFHALARIKRNKSLIHSIQTEDGKFLEEQDEIKAHIVDITSEKFAFKAHPKLDLVLNQVTKVITMVDNNILIGFPEEDEIKQVVFALNPDSSHGPNEFSGQFFQACWWAVGMDVVRAAQSFYVDSTLPRWFNANFIILAPKV